MHLRSIPMIAEVREALLEEREIQLAFGNHRTQTVDGVTGFVFTQAKGTVYNPEAINRAIERIITTTMNIYAEVHPDMKKKSLTKMAGKIIINRSDMSTNEAIAYDEENDVERRPSSRF